MAKSLWTSINSPAAKELDRIWHGGSGGHQVKQEPAMFSYRWKMVSWAALDKVLPASGGKRTFLSIPNLWGHTWSLVLHSGILLARETCTRGDSPVKGHKDGKWTVAPVLWRKAVGELRLLSLEKWNRMMDIISI